MAVKRWSLRMSKGKKLPRGMFLWAAYLRFSTGKELPTGVVVEARTATSARRKAIPIVRKRFSQLR
jgi:hypothetical protein